MFFIILLLLFIYQCIRAFVNRKTDSVRSLIGKTAIVTGGNSGLGYGAAVLLASRGCKVILADRDNAEKSRDEIIRTTENPNISYKHLDLSSLKNVREFCEDIKKNEKKIDILVNNAGIGASKIKTTEDGLNFVMQVNFFGAFLLTHLLLEPLKAAKSARIVFVSSVTAYFNVLTLANLNLTNFEVNSESVQALYANSKLCNILAAQEFGKRLQKYGIIAHSIDPCGVRTQIFQKTYEVAGIWLWRTMFTISMFLVGQDGLNAAQTILHVATSEKVKDKTGGHFAFCAPALMKPSILNNQTFCQQIWEETEKLVQLKPEEKLID